MDHAYTAESVGLTGRICRVCGCEVGADQPIAYEIYGCTQARVRHRRCHNAIECARMEALMQAANFCQKSGADFSALDCLTLIGIIGLELERKAAA